jgi:hypothetical protein
LTGRRVRDDFATFEVIRPAALLTESAARLVVAGLARDDALEGGHWTSVPGIWRRYDRPWSRPGGDPGEAQHLGTVSCVYDSPQRYSVTIFRASITTEGIRQGWTVQTLCDDALRHADLTLDSCPRVDLMPPPRPLRAG